MTIWTGVILYDLVSALHIIIAVLLFTDMLGVSTAGLLGAPFCGAAGVRFVGSSGP